MTKFQDLKPHTPRKFIPQAANLLDDKTVTALYEELLAKSVDDLKGFEQWLAHGSELDAAVDQAAGILYINMTCQTDDKEAVQAYEDYIKTIVPAIKPLKNRIDHRYIELSQAFPQIKDKYFVFDREVRTEIELFREENIPLATRIQLLSQEYQSLCGAMTVEFDREEKTLPQMAKYYEDTDRTVRERAWRAVVERRYQDRGRLDKLFDDMLGLRQQVARNAGFADFRDYQFKSYHRYDYTPQDCRDFHLAVEKGIVPLCAKILERRKDQLGVETLRPWDLNVDPLGRDALKPFEKIDDLVSGVSRIMTTLDSQLGEMFAVLSTNALLDLDSRKGKAPGGYQQTLSEARKPFIFMNAVGTDQDVRTLLHEGGHAFHALFCADQPLYSYRHAPMEFCEVASMSMELLADPQLNIFYNDSDAERSTTSHLEDVLQILVWVAIVDAFQHWIYEYPDHTPAQRTEAWLGLQKRFGSGVVSWEGLEDYLATAWHRQLHIFEVPFYYIEYAIAQLGALQLWAQARENAQGALDHYKSALTLGGSVPLKELFKAAGLNFDFSQKAVEPLSKMVAQELKIL